MPTSVEKARANCRDDRLARCASAASDRSSSGCSVIQGHLSHLSGHSHRRIGMATDALTAFGTESLGILLSVLGR
ncbi:hypothetical protein [Nocardia sp. NPDC051570]|uniref:hypothetical protein n=1 Tax=Nocardia sp. NPDC051570 TaxID=3364324 RepID=UPI0037AAE3D6